MRSTVEFTASAAMAPTWGVVGSVYAILAEGEQTGGQYTLVEAFVPPDGGPPPHTHTREDEAFYLLEGEMTVTIAGRPLVLTPGGFAFGPRNVEHTFRNTGRGVARMLVWITPAGLEHFFRAVGAPLRPGTREAAAPTADQVEKLLATAPRYGLVIRPPG